jgi:hypothetical protein
VTGSESRRAGRGWPAWPLAVIVLGHWVLGLGFNYITPVLEGPDEPNHFLFIRYLQIYHQLPVQGTELNAVRAHHAPAYFVLGALLLAWSPPGSAADWASLGFQENPRYLFRLDDPEPDNKSVWLHGRPDEQWPYQGLPLAVHVARLLSLAFSTLAVVLTYWAAATMWPGNLPLAVLAAGLVAFDPMVAFMGAIVQNDTATLASGAAVVLLLSRNLRRSPGFWDWLLVGTVLAVGILFKSGLLAMAPVVAAGALYAAWRAGPAWRARGRALLASAFGVALPIALLDGWWFVRNQMLYGDWTANASIVVLSHGFTPEAGRSFLPLALYYLASGLLGRFGNGGTIDFPMPAYAAAGLLALIAVLGLVRLWRASAGAQGRAPSAKSSTAAIAPSGTISEPGTIMAAPMGLSAPVEWSFWALHFLTAAVIFASVLVFAVVLNAGATGKYQFPAFPSMAILLAAGALAWFPARWHGRVAAGLLLLTAAASVYAMIALLWPSYGPPRQPLPFELDRATPLEANLGGAARILGYHLDETTVDPGDTLKVTVYWLPEAVTPTPQTVFIQVFVPDVGVVAQRDLYPGGGTYPTNVWVPGRPFVDTYYLHLPPDAQPATGAPILFGLYDEATGQRLTATGSDADPGGNNFVKLGSVNIQP